MAHLYDNNDLLRDLKRMQLGSQRVFTRGVAENDSGAYEAAEKGYARRKTATTWIVWQIGVKEAYALSAPQAAEAIRHFFKHGTLPSDKGHEI